MSSGVGKKDQPVENPYFSTTLIRKLRKSCPWISMMIKNKTNQQHCWCRTSTTSGIGAKITNCWSTRGNVGSTWSYHIELWDCWRNNNESLWSYGLRCYFGCGADIHPSHWVRHKPSDGCFEICWNAENFIWGVRSALESSPTIWSHTFLYIGLKVFRSSWCYFYWEMISFKEYVLLRYAERCTKLEFATPVPRQ